MHQMMVWLEGTGLGVWTRESGSIWAYPTILTLHTVGLGVVVGASAVVDFRLLGLAPGIPIPSLTPLFRFIWWAFALNAMTGVVLFVSEATDKSRQPVFYIKLGLIALALWNTTLVRRIVCRPTDAGPSPGGIRRDRQLAAASLCLWTAAIVAGRLMAYL
jgi:hypothetical protein